MYNFENERVIKKIKDLHAKKVVLQLPNGLKTHGFKLSKLIEVESKAKVYIISDPCYGACDIASEAMDQLKADVIVHYGHAEIARTHAHSQDKRNVIFVEARYNGDILKPLTEAAKMINTRRIGLLATVQHVHFLGNASVILKKLGKEVYVGKAGGKLKYDGQVLGCDFTAAKSIIDKVESYIVIASGKFHGIGVKISTGKRTVTVDPYFGKVIDVTDEAEKLAKIKKVALGKLWDSKKIGVLISLKHGQIELNLAQQLKKRLESLGKKCVLIVGRELTGLNLNSFSEVDLFVNTACPRIALDDRECYIKPILNVSDLFKFLESAAVQ